MNRDPTRLSLAAWSVLGQISGVEEPATLASARDELATALQAWQTDPSEDERELARAAGVLILAADDASVAGPRVWDELAEAVGAVLGGGG